MPPFRLWLVCLLLLALPLAAQAQMQPELHRGLNLSSWLANAPRQPLFGRDFIRIKQVGFDHVRLPFNPTHYGFKLSPAGSNATQMDFIALDRALAQAEQYGLPVILDVHVDSDFTNTLEHHGWAENEFVDLWRVLAERYKGHSQTILIFELLNEPQYYKTEDLWNKLAARTTTAIRAISPNRTIIIGAPHGSEIDALPYLQTSADPHIIYAFHFYEPYPITHQGIHMGFEDKAIRYFRNLPYPSALATKTAATYAPLAPDFAEARKELEEYTSAPWDAAHIASRIDVARDWAAQHHVRILCGEFGILRNHIDADSRYRWIADARAAMDADAIGWEVWDYADLFGIATPVGATSTDPVDGSVRLTDPEKGSRAFEPQALTALGLK